MTFLKTDLDAGVKRSNFRPFRRGSILLEAILALLFITMAVGAVSGLFSSSMDQVRQVEQRTRAMFLAETMLAEFQTGLIDISEGQSGDFAGKPDKFFWEIEEQSTELPELKRLKISITYDDLEDGFTYNTYRMYSPSLNLSAEQMKEISTDPVQMQELGAADAGLQDLLEMLSEFPGGDTIVNALLKGGVPGMMSIFNKVVSGQLTPEELFALMDGGSTDGSVESLIIGDDDDSYAGDAWSDYDTAGIGEDPLAKTDSEDGGKSDGEGDLADASDSTDSDVAEDPTTTDKPDDGKSTTGMVTREEAIARMQEMLRRIANKPK